MDEDTRAPRTLPTGTAVPIYLPCWRHLYRLPDGIGPSAPVESCVLSMLRSYNAGVRQDLRYFAAVPCYPGGREV